MPERFRNMKILILVDSTLDQPAMKSTALNEIVSAAIELLLAF